VNVLSVCIYLLAWILNDQVLVPGLTGIGLIAALYLQFVGADNVRAVLFL
jgi:hypothetical protein